MGSDPMDTRDAVVLEQHRVLHAVRDAAFAAEHVDDGVAESGADLVVQILLGLVAELADLVERLKG